MQPWDLKILALALVSACATTEKATDPWQAAQPEHCAVYEVYSTHTCYMVIKDEPPKTVNCETRCNSGNP